MNWIDYALGFFSGALFAVLFIVWVFGSDHNDGPEARA